MVWMALYHFSFDLNHFGYWKQDFYNNPVWTWQRTCILSLFLLCVGLGQTVAVSRGQTRQQFWRRWVQVAGGALLVSAGSWLMYPRSFIYFGVLHGIAVMLILARVSAARSTPVLIALGVAAVVAKSAAPMLLGGSAWGAMFNSPLLNWLGLITRKPVTEDYVPVLPWMALVWWGMAIGRWCLAHHPQALAWSPPPLAPHLAWLGRWSLSFYLLHQPILIGVLTLLA